MHQKQTWRRRVEVSGIPNNDGEKPRENVKKATTKKGRVGEGRGSPARGAPEKSVNAR